jgi:hypothetical protein
MAEDRAQYEFRSVRILRGTEARAIAKWQNDGWELSAENRGRLRTEVVFRRPKPRTVIDHLASIWGSFRGMRPARQRRVLAGSGGLIAAVVVIIVVAATHGGAVSAVSVAHQTRAAAIAAAPSDSPTTPPVTEPSPPSTAPEAEAVLTPKNNRDLAALLALSDPKDASVERFAAKYSGRTIRFRGNIADLQNHGDYRTRYDILMNAGDFHENTATGPDFQFRNVNTTSDLHFKGSNIPDIVGAGDNVRVVAQVGEYESTTGLLLLNPISTEFR